RDHRDPGPGAGDRVTTVLVINSGSSSFKYQLVDVESEVVLASGLVERIGQPTGAASHTVLLGARAAGARAAGARAAGAGADGGPQASVTALDATYREELPIPDHTAGFQVMLDAFAAHGPSLVEGPPVAVGHRVVHGG